MRPPLTGISPSDSERKRGADSFAGGNLSEPSAQMPTYRCYFRNSDSRIKGTESVVCDDDDAAAVQAEILLAERVSCVSVEVWEGRRLVYRTKR